MYECMYESIYLSIYIIHNISVATIYIYIYIYCKQNIPGSPHCAEPRMKRMHAAKHHPSTCRALALTPSQHPGDGREQCVCRAGGRHSLILCAHVNSVPPPQP